MTDILIQKKSIILDASTLSTLIACGRLADYRFNHHLQAISGRSSSFEKGSIIHKFLEVFYGHRIKGFDRNTSVAQGLVAAVAYSQDPKEVTNCKPEDIKLALDTCEQYVEYYKNDSWIPLEVEAVKGKQVYEDEDIRIIWKAKLDWIVDTSQGIYPVDHKTMSQRRDTSKLNHQFIGQCFIMGTRTMFVNKIGFQTSLKPADKFLRVPVNYTADNLAEWQSTTLPYWAKIMMMYSESEYWPPNFNHCENKYGFCQFKDVCETDRNLREASIKMNFFVGEPWDISNSDG